MLSELVSSSLIAAVKLAPASLHCSTHYKVYTKYNSAFSKTVCMYETRRGSPLAQDPPPSYNYDVDTINPLKHCLLGLGASLVKR